MAKHDGIFTRLFGINSETIKSWSWMGYYSSDGSTIPQSQLPDDNSFVTRGMLNVAIGSGNPIIRLTFNEVAEVQINWQFDLADGVNTYQELFGNYVEAVVHVTGSTLGYIGTWTYDDSQFVRTVTFDMGGIVQTGYIKFGG